MTGNRLFMSCNSVRLTAAQCRIPYQVRHVQPTAHSWLGTACTTASPSPMPSWQQLWPRCTLIGQIGTFFSKTNSMALHLICKEIVSVFKDYNLKRHYLQKHAARFDAYQRTLHKDKITELKTGLSSQQNLF